MLWKRAALGQDAQAVQVQYQHVLSANADMKAIPKKPLTNAELKVDLTVLTVLPAKLPVLLASPSTALLWQLPQLPCQLLLKPCTRIQVHLMQSKPNLKTM